MPFIENKHKNKWQKLSIVGGEVTGHPREILESLGLPIINYNYPPRKFVCFSFWSGFVHLKVNLQPVVPGWFFLDVFAERELYKMEGMKHNIERNLQIPAQLPAQ